MARLLADMFFCALLSMLTIGIASKSVDTSFQDELLARILSLESQGREQAAKIQHMEVQLKNQDERLARQEEIIDEYKVRVGELERALKTRVTEDSEEPGEDVNRNSGISRATNFKAGTGVIRKSRMLVDTGDVVAFHAVIANASELAHVGVKQTIVFPDVTINVGGGYHYHTGIFIAPKAGIYIFSISITLAIKDQNGVVVSIFKNGNDIKIASAFAHGNANLSDQGSVTVVTQLSVGDEVLAGLVEPADASLWGGKLTSFMGCLIVAL